MISLSRRGFAPLVSAIFMRVLQSIDFEKDRAWPHPRGGKMEQPKNAKLQGDALENAVYKLGAEWEVVKGHHLEKKFSFPDFKSALAFTNRVGEIAESEGHHPDIHLGWGKVRVVVWTHDVDGLTGKDFVLATKIESLPRG